MKQIRLLKVALCVSLVGLFLLIIFAHFSEPLQTKIILVGDNVGRTILIYGEVVRATQREDVNFFEVRDNTAEITVVAFGPMERLAKGSKVEVMGQVEIYEGELEVVADYIKVL